MRKVSVIIPTYNRREYVQDAIDSVLAQTYTDYEVIVIDDGSTDGTEEALRARYGDRIRYEWQENQGESVARNRGIEMARGEYIAFLDSDDLWLPEKLEKQVGYLDSLDEPGMVFAQAWLIDGNGIRITEQPLGSRESKSSPLSVCDLLLHNKVTGPSTVVCHVWVLEQAGGFALEIRYGEDWDLWLRIAQNAPIHRMHEPLACIRIHRGTQCYYPESSERIARVLDDHLRLLAKVPGSIECEPYDWKQRSTAYQYLQAFVAELGVGTAETAASYLRSARAKAPAMLGDMDSFGQLVLNQMIIGIEQVQEACLNQGLEFVDSILDHLRAVGAYEPRFARKLLASANATLGFWVYRRWDRRSARPFLINAIRTDANWLRNTGVLSIIVKSFFEGRLSESPRVSTYES